MQYRWQARYFLNLTLSCPPLLHYYSHKESKHYDKKIPTVLSPTLIYLQGMGFQKRGLQARAINALHCNAFLAIIIIIIIITIVHISHH